MLRHPFNGACSDILLSPEPVIRTDVTTVHNPESLSFASDRKFECIVQALPDAVLVHCSGTIVFANPATLRLLGATSLNQLLGKNVFDFIHPEDIHAIQERSRLLPGLDAPESPIEHRMIALDGSVREVEGLAMPITWEGVPAIEVVVRDIAERKRVEHSIQNWNKRLELTRDSGLKIGLWEWDLEKNTIEWSDESYRQFGFTRETFSGRVEDALTRIHPDDLPKVQEAIDKAIQTHGDYAAQYRLVHPDGTICWLDARGSVVKNGSTKMIGIGIDITDLKKSEAALAESREDYLLLLNSTAEGIYGIDLDGKCTFCNPAAARMFGYESPSQLLGRSIHDAHHFRYSDGTSYPADECLIFKSFRTGEGTHSDSEVFLRLDGSVLPVEYWSYPTRREGKVVGCVVTFLDISGRRKAEEALRRSERYYRLLFEQNPHPMWVYEEKTLRFLAVNQAAIDHYGFSREEFLAMTLRDIRPQEELPRLLQSIAARPSGIDKAGVWSHRTKSGKAIYVEITDQQIDFEGHSAFLVLANDVTDSLRAEEALRTSEEKYREFIENASVGIYRSSPDGTLLDVNPALVNILGYNSKYDLMSLNLNTDIYEKAEDRADIVRRTGNDGRVQGAVTNWKRKDGTVITVSLDGKEIRKDGKVSHYEVLVEDITKTRSLEEQLRQSQKMEAVGRLAGGVAHDFNNALGVITGYSELLQFKLTHDETLHRQAGEIFKAGQRAAALTRQLLAFSRKQTMRPQIINLNNIVRDMEKMLRRLIGENIDLVHVGASDLSMVLADPGQIEQVLMNLVVNARDAMPMGGSVRIETADCELDETVKRKYDYVNPGKYVMLSVTDTGCGMDEKVQSHVFEPFFTTKEVGKGTGLGLSTVYGIVKQSGGYIWVDSALGKGTRFHLYLPITTDKVKTTHSDQAVAAVPLGSETILLVEDEDALRDLTASALRGGGYNVLEAGSAESALAIVKQYGGRIHMLVTDVILPGLSGCDLATSIQAHYPKVRTVFMSGYTDDLLGRHGVLGQDITLLEKPFSNRTLLTSIRELLDKDSPSKK